MTDIYNTTTSNETAVARRQEALRVLEERIRAGDPDVISTTLSSLAYMTREYPGSPTAAVGRSLLRDVYEGKLTSPQITLLLEGSQRQEYIAAMYKF